MNPGLLGLERERGGDGGYTVLKGGRLHLPKGEEIINII
jgi:hypothetical protein